MSVRNNARNEQSEIMNEIKKNEPPDAAITSGEVQGNLRHATWNQAANQFMSPMLDPGNSSQPN